MDIGVDTEWVIMRNYLDNKLDEIVNFIESNHKYLKSNDGFRNKACNRIKNLIILASFVTDDVDIEDIIKIANSLNMDGLVEFFSDTLNKKFFVDLNKQLDEINDKLVLSKKSLMTIKQFNEIFDAKVVDIK